MKQKILKILFDITIFTVAIILSWGGLLYATNDPNQFRLIGIIASFIGYVLFFWGVIRYENN